MAVTQDPRSKNDDVLYRLLRDGKIAEFNQQRGHTATLDLINCDFRGVDLRGLDAAGLDLTGCYFRQTDLRGIDFSNAKMEGASINSAKISGTYFPKELSATEIELSLIHGTRMRYSK
ncbi:MAG: pentapeptide repeat-containing protein [Pseudomonadota bacterium]|nr:pentapeptide repeat-containing protein [Pseudomonadota bacterium]